MTPQSNNEEKKLQKFSIQELGGAFGDWGTLIPFIIGYVSIVGLNPTSIFLTLGITNIILGIRFNLPLPVQPQKTIATIAISERWDVGRVISTGFATGLIWTGLGFTKILNKIARIIPEMSVRAIQLGLALILGFQAFNLIWDDWWQAAVGLSLIVIFIGNKKIPAALLITGFGIGWIILSNQVSLQELTFQWPIIRFYFPSLREMGIGMLRAGIAQLFLTLTNVMVATVKLAHDLFPQKKETFTANALAQNMGIMNIVNPLIGGMPLCHGSGGLASQYAFGARNGGSMIYEGILEIFFGLCFGNSLFIIFETFPTGLLGSMLLYTAIVLGTNGYKKTERKYLPIVIFSAISCLFLNISWGFLIVLGLYFIIYQVLIPLILRKHKR